MPPESNRIYPNTFVRKLLLFDDEVTLFVFGKLWCKLLRLAMYSAPVWV